MMMENYRTEFIWRLTRNCSDFLEGLRRAGFGGGWLERERVDRPANDERD